MEENEENEKAEKTEMCNEKKNLFELTQKNLKEFSMQMRKAVVVERIAIHKRRSYILEWREKVRELQEEEEGLNDDEVIAISSTESEDNTELVEAKSSSESFKTAESDLNKCDNVHDEAFLERDTQIECIENILEHSDLDNGIVLYERNLKCQSDGESTLSTIKSIPPLDYDTDTLKDELKSFGHTPGPITKSTKKVYLKQLMRFKKHPERPGIVEEDPSKISEWIFFI